MFIDKVLEERVCVHCTTEEQAKTLLAWATEKGLTWNGGALYIGAERWGNYGKHTVYYLGQGLYGDVIGAKEDGKEILSYEEALAQEMEYKGKKIAFPELSAQLKSST